MRVFIYSYKTMKELIDKGERISGAVISFSDPPQSRAKKGWEEISLEGMCERVFRVRVPDIDRELLEDYGYTYESYIDNAPALAEFILKAYLEGLDIICQCDYGQSRSAACAAAILQYFEGRGIDIFADYRYYPNQLVYHKVFDALTEHGGKNTKE